MCVNNGPEDNVKSGEGPEPETVPEVSDVSLRFRSGENEAGFESESSEPESSEPEIERRLRAQWQQPLALPAGFKDRVLAAKAKRMGQSPTAAMTKDAEEELGDRPAPRIVDSPQVTPKALPDAVPGLGKLLAFRRRPTAVWRVVAGGALAASVLAGTFGVELERRHREVTRERAIANQQFEQATRITDAALAHTREQLERAGVLEAEGR